MDERDLETRFLEVAVSSAYLRAREPKKANQEYKRLYEMKAELRSLPDKGAAVLKRISQSDDVEVRMSAAAFATSVLADLTASLASTEATAGDVKQLIVLQVF